METLWTVETCVPVPLLAEIHALLVNSTSRTHYSLSFDPHRMGVGVADAASASIGVGVGVDDRSAAALDDEAAAS